MRGLLELALILGLVLIPIRFSQRNPAESFWPTLLLCGGYFMMALFILPRLPA